MAKYTYWNKWTTPIFESEDPNYENIRDGAIRESLEYYNSEDRVEVAPGLKGRLYESEFDFFKRAREFGYQSLISIEDFIHDQFKICFLDYFQSGYFPDEEFITDVTNLQSEYRKGRKPIFRVNVRKKNWMPNVYTVVTSDVETEIIEDAYWRLFLTEQEARNTQRCHLTLAEIILNWTLVYLSQVTLMV